MPTIVRETGQARTVVVDRVRTVASVQKQHVPVKVVAPGPQGPKGETGTSADGAYPAFSIAFGDASGVVLVLGPGTQEVTLVSMEVEEAFNGAGASVAIGIAGNPGLLMPASYNDPATLGVYEAAPRVQLPGGTPIHVSLISGAGATAGRAQLVIQTTPTS